MAEPKVRDLIAPMVEQFIRRGFHFEARYQYGTLPVALLEIDETAPTAPTK